MVLQDVVPAYKFFRARDLTSRDTLEKFMPNKSLRRDSASVFFGQFAKQILGMTPDTSKSECYEFTDLDQARADRKDEVIEACQLDLFKGSDNKFMPTQELTWIQAITVLMRMINGFEDEKNVDHRGDNYRELTKKL